MHDGQACRRRPLFPRSRLTSTPEAAGIEVGWRHHR